MDGSSSWNFYNGTAWVATNGLGNAPYEGGYGPLGTWFHETSGTYNGYDVYIAQETTYFSLDHTAAGPTYWRVSAAGAWGYYDGEAWHATAGFGVEPMNAWFHGYGPDAGWDTYNYADGSYFTHDYSVYWQYLTASTSWNYWNGTAWVPTSGLGVIA